MGHGVKQRAQIKMTDDEIAEFLNGRHTMSMATINPDGSIHMVAMWYGFLEGEIAIESKAKAQKVLNLRRNPNMTVMIEDGDTYDQLRGVQIAGIAEIVEDPDRMFEAGICVFSRNTAPYTEAMRPGVEAMLHKRVVVKLHPKRIASWDHRKLGLSLPKPSS
jgi:PPOX class probable F420-dependent enzyme